MSRVPSSSKPSSILLVRLSSLGDVVLATPLARALRRTFPEARIDVAVAAEFADVWKDNPHINEVLTVDRKKSAPASALALRRDASLKRYDMVVDLQNNIRSLFLRLGFAHRSVRCKK